MKAGAAYEKFVYERFKKFFADMELKLNDRIPGKESGIKREIDISISGQFAGVDLLYLVQCKDQNKPADVKIIGEFSAVIRDVGASKGFLVCSAGFTKTIHTYAKTLGIELLSVEDINSEKWHVDIEIPFLYIKNELGEAQMSGYIIPNEALVAKNQTDIKVSPEDFKFISIDNGGTKTTLHEYINEVYQAQTFDIFNGKAMILDDPQLRLYFAKIWVPVHFEINFTVKKTYYLKYLKPDEYAQISDHLRVDTLPLNFKFENIMLGLNDEYVEVDGAHLPVFTKLNFTLEERPPSISAIHFNGMVLGGE